jgi:phage protein D
MKLICRRLIAAETSLELTGFGEQLDGRWLVTTATHTFDGAGYVTSVEAELGS